MCSASRCLREYFCISLAGGPEVVLELHWWDDAEARV